MRRINRVGAEIIALKEEQLKAIMDLENNIYLSGRPGTGKSEAILYRIMNMLNKRACSEKEILIIVSKNINEVRLRNKLRNLGLKSNFINIFTIKEFYLNLVRENCNDKLNLKSTFTYINRKEERKIVLEIINKDYKEKIRDKTQSSYNIRDYIDKKKEERLTEENYIDIVLENDNKVKNEIFNKYCRYLIDKDLVDYNDILKYSEILFKNSDIRDIYKKKYKNINIHKVCEMTTKEYSIISKIFTNNIMMVSDKLDGDNEIYQLFKNRFRHKTIEFKTNHRVTKNLAEIENSFVNSMWEDQGYINSSSKEVGEKPCLIKTKNIKSEAEFLVCDILKDKLISDINNYGIIVKDSLYGEQLKIYLDKYSKGSLNFSLRNDINFLSNNTIDGMISYMNLIIDKHSDYHFKKILNEFYLETVENIYNIYNNDLGLNLTDLIDGSSIKYKDPFWRLYRYLEAENSVIINIESQRLINNEVLVKLNGIKIDLEGNILEEISKEIYIGESSSINAAIKKGKEFLKFVSGHLLIGNNMVGTINAINKLNKFLEIGELNHKSYYDIFEISKKYYKLDYYEIDNILEKLSIDKSTKKIYDIKNILFYLIENNIEKDSDKRVKFIEENIDKFYKIKSDIVEIRSIIRKKYVRPIDILDKVIEVTGNKKIHLFDWDSGNDYKEYLKDFFMYFDTNNKNIIEEVIRILDKISIWKKDSGEFISKENIIPILTLKECEGFHFDNIYICGVNEENYDIRDKMSFYTGITRAKKNLKFIRPIQNIYGENKEMSILLKDIEDKLDIYRY